MGTIKKILSTIDTFVFDIDGVLTDGTVLVTEKGDHLRSFDVKDGYAIFHALRKGYRIIVISGGDSYGVRHRLNYLGVRHIYLGVEDKLKALREILKKLSADPQKTSYMGDDMPDLGVMSFVALPSAPCDAIEEILSVCKFKSSKPGGKGAARELIEKVMKVQGRWVNGGKVNW
ncbi:MAG: hypothetical protein A3D92_23340 [Bacteroidetes bacterium RIFCSPHIGHO2_02_FULL_44_7]|nr:MAG: hypothetical protein A3H98_03390 [Bacteroidetes bacterium RIFCSPLOWO2_02_FULL_36_8]OFY69486.1 MAG: hypothetical protein A3G23_10635 [Bacteroidetes bacterium RIFCSPLOWO2_12_FULL_37_12]OFZ08059.1 MAG: hypothetical protein A3D92_23340 [Bacteroidetes bacterium RIFCSPHIGHO2_02_FULL_44_7]